MIEEYDTYFMDFFYKTYYPLAAQNAPKSQKFQKQNLFKYTQ